MDDEAFLINRERAIDYLNTRERTLPHQNNQKHYVKIYIC